MKEQMTDFQATAAKGLEDAVRLKKDALDAFVSSAAIAAKGYGELSANWVEFAKSQIEEGTRNAQAILGADSAKEAVELQTGYAKQAFENSVAASAKFSEISLRTANQILSPIGQRVNAAFEQFVQPERQA